MIDADSEQDFLLALGVVPVAVTDWYGDQPYATWPWAQQALGDAKPTVLKLTDGFQFLEIAKTKPDLIVGVNSGMERATTPSWPSSPPPWPTPGATRVVRAVARAARADRRRGRQSRRG